MASEVVDFLEPPAVEATADGWTVTETPRSLMPAALLGIAVLLVWRFVGVRFLREGELQSDWLPLLLGGVLPTLFILVYPIWMIRRAGGRVIGGWPGWQRFLLEGAIAIGALICVQLVNMLVAILYTLLFRESPGIPDQFQELAESGSLLALTIMAVMACVWAPISEELFFRRFVMRAFASRLSLWAAIVLQAFVFAILHHYGAMHLTAIFVLGLAMGGLYAWRRTILTSMILHMLQNTMAMTFLGAFMLFSRYAPILGVTGDGQPDGFHIVQVQEGSAAAAAGLQAGDVITKIEGAPVQDRMTLRLMYWAAGLDGRAEMEIRRNGETTAIRVTPLAAPAAEKSTPAAPQPEEPAE